LLGSQIAKAGTHFHFKDGHGGTAQTSKKPSGFASENPEANHP